MARAPKPVTSADLLELAYVSDPQLAPGGKSAAVVVTRVVSADGGKPKRAPAASGSGGKQAKYEPPRYLSRIELYDLNAKGKPKPTELTQGRYGDSSPRFSPSGDQIAFLSVREEGAKPNLYLLPLAGGEARRLTSHGAGVSEFVWHPNGKQLAYLSRGDWERGGVQV